VAAAYEDAVDDMVRHAFAWAIETATDQCSATERLSAIATWVECEAIRLAGDTEQAKRMAAAVVAPVRAAVALLSGEPGQVAE
jgi:hypothetical protein